MNRLKVTTWAGIVGPLLFIAVFTVEGWLRPGYRPLASFVSELSLGPRGWIQVVNFLIFGILLLLFTRGVAKEFREGKASKAGPLLLGAVAVCCLLSGIFVTDPSTIFFGQKSWHGILHGIFGAVVFLLMPASCIVFLNRFWNNPAVRPLRLITLIAAVLVSAAVILLIIATKLSFGYGIFLPWLGLIQRAAIMPYMLWLSIFAVVLSRKKA